MDLFEITRKNMLEREAPLASRMRPGPLTRSSDRSTSSVRTDFFPGRYARTASAP